MADFLDSNPKSGEAKSEQEANKNASGTTSSATNDYAQNRTIGVNTSSNKADDCSDLTDVNQQEDDNAAPKSFPQRMMEILSNDRYQHIIGWLPHGNGFMIHKKKVFASEVLPKYFRGTRFTSFTRKLNRWGFTRVSRGPETGAYYHQLFQRDKPDLCLQMTSQSGNKYQSTAMQGHLLPSSMMPGSMGNASNPWMMPMMNPYMMFPPNMTPQQQQMWQQQMWQMQQMWQQHVSQVAHQSSSHPPDNATAMDNNNNMHNTNNPGEISQNLSLHHDPSGAGVHEVDPSRFLADDDPDGPAEI